jgi:hypothetical protein
MSYKTRVAVLLGLVVCDGLVWCLSDMEPNMV